MVIIEEVCDFQKKGFENSKKRNREETEDNSRYKRCREEIEKRDMELDEDKLCNAFTFTVNFYEVEEPKYSEKELIEEIEYCIETVYIEECTEEVMVNLQLVNIDEEEYEDDDE